MARFSIKSSLLINKRLKSSRTRTPRRKIDIKPIRLGRRITEKEIEKAIDEGWNEAAKRSA